jgi:hypothetical protein
VTSPRASLRQLWQIKEITAHEHKRPAMVLYDLDGSPPCASVDVFRRIRVQPKRFNRSGTSLVLNGCNQLTSRASAPGMRSHEHTGELPRQIGPLV